MSRSTLSTIMFLLIFFLIYGGFHLYMYLKAKSALGFGTKTALPVICFLALMVFAPLLIRAFEKPGLEPVARVFGYIGYTWMALLFLFFSISIMIDLLRLFVWLAGLITSRNLSSLTGVTPYHFVLPFALALGICVYGFFEAANIQVERTTIASPKVPERVGSFKIVQISDVHLGVMVGERKLGRILDIVRRENPDLLVSTGDLVDGEMCNLAEAIRLLKQVNPPWGKFAVTGNHEYYAGLDKALDFTRNAGFTILRGEATTVDSFLNVAGVDDHQANSFGGSRGMTEHDLLASLPKGNFTLFLKHRPLLDKGALGLFDLQLSGHAHKGQIFPFSIFTKLSYPTDDGCLRLSDGSYLCVSRGAGTWGPPIRFLAPPDVVVIELVHK
jgi:predicted MPP superfamily phosphohydrolase